MDSGTYVGQLQSLGERLHEHDGVWWRERRPFFWRPAMELEAVERGRARPNRFRALVGFGHRVRDWRDANQRRTFLLYERSDAAPFTMESLSSNRRNQVRRGFRRCDVRRIEALGPVLEDLREINISARERTGVGRPTDYYRGAAVEWRRKIEKIFALPERDWWGAFVDGRLVAYYHSYVVEDSLIVDTAKAHTQYLDHYPVAGLLFTVMDDALNRKGVRWINYGGLTLGDEKLTVFKESYGFRKVEIPMWIELTPVFRLAARIAGQASLLEQPAPEGVESAEG